MSKQLTRTNNLSGKQSNRHLTSNKDLSFDSESPANRVLNLQRTTGNQVVQNLFKSGAIQPKLKIGQPGDKYELEADRIAEQVMRMPDSVCPTCMEEKKEEVVNREVIRRESLSSEESSFIQRQNSEEERKKREEEEEVIQPKFISSEITPLIHRQVDDTERKKREEEELVQPKLLSGSIEPVVQRQLEEEEEEEMLQTKENGSSTTEVTSNIESGINSLRGGGQPLSESTRKYFEPRFGYDFSGVRVHTGVEVNETAKSINARAFTLGNNVVFGTSGYSPETAEGKRLLAHELAHVVQQVGRKPMINRWSQKGVSDVLCRNEGKQFVEKLNKLKVYEYEKIIWKYKVLNKEGFWDVHTEESMGEFDPATGEVYVKKALSDEEASSTLFHEIIHVGQKEKKTKLKKQEEQTEEQRKLEEQENEYEAWIQTEKYRIKVGLPEQQPGFRTKKGKKYIVDEAKVREYIDELYTRTSPKQTKKYITLGIYPEGIKPIEKKWECLKTPGKGSKKSGGQVIQRYLRMDYALPEQAVQPKPLSNSIEPVVQRQFEEEEKEGMLQTKENGSSTAEITPNIESGVNSLKGGGQPLSESTRNYFEPRFGYDFSGVRVHTGVGANETAKSINARAFTFGNDVVFSASNYSLEIGEGKKLLAHELTHVVQQKGGSDTINRDEKKPEEKPKTSAKKEELSGKPGWQWPYWYLIEPVLFKLPYRWQKAYWLGKATSGGGLFDITLGRELAYKQVTGILNLMYAGVYTQMSENKPEFSKGLEIAEDLSGVSDTYLNLISLGLRMDLEKYLKDEIPGPAKDHLGWSILYGLALQGAIVGGTYLLEEDIDFLSLPSAALKKWFEKPQGFSRMYTLENKPDERWKHPFLASPSGLSLKYKGLFEEEKPYTLSFDLGFNIASVLDLYPEDEEQKKRYKGLEVYPYLSLTFNWPKSMEEYEGEIEPTAPLPPKGYFLPEVGSQFLAGVFFGDVGVYTLLEGGGKLSPSNELLEAYWRTGMLFKDTIPRTTLQLDGEYSYRPPDSKTLARINAATEIRILDNRNWKLYVGGKLGYLFPTFEDAKGAFDVGGGLSFYYTHFLPGKSYGFKTGFDISSTWRLQDPFEETSSRLFSIKGTTLLFDLLRVSIEYHKYEGKGPDIGGPASDIRFWIGPGPGIFELFK